MTWNVNEKEFESVSSLTGPQRCSHFIKRVADFEELWGLKGETGWALTGDADGNEYFPVWPHEIYAKAYAQEDWSDYYPERIDLYDWIDEWIPGFLEDGKSVAVFLTPSDSGVTVAPNVHKEHLREEMSLYE